MLNLSKFVNSQFANVIKYSCIADRQKNDLSFHNIFRIKNIKKGQQTYCGELNCGITAFILGNILKNYIPIKMFLQESRYGKYKQDHVFLKYDDTLIDPTYRQFFTNNSKDGLSLYNNYLYEDLPPFFVGSYKELQDMYTTLKKKNIEEFGYNILPKKILDNWKANIDITNKLDNFDIIYNKDYVRNFIQHGHPSPCGGVPIP